MFDAAFNAFMAVHRAGFLFGGMVCLGIATLILLSERQTRKRFRRTKGRIAAVRSHTRVVNPSCQRAETHVTHYYPVYEYIDQNSNTVQALSLDGSTVLYNKAIGTPVTLWVNPEEPLDVKVHNPKLTFLLALVFLAPGLTFTYLGTGKIGEEGINPLTLLIVVLLFAAPIVKIVRSIKPRNEWETPSEFQKRKNAERRQKLTSLEGHILSLQETQKLLKEEAKHLRTSALAFAVIGLLLLTGGQWFAYDMKRFTLHADAAQGTVVDNAARARQTDGEMRYYPVVEFTTSGGTVQRFTSGKGHTAPLYSRGDAVHILYNKQKPHAAKIDPGLQENPPALVCYGLGIVLLLGALRHVSVLRFRAEDARFFR